MSKKENNTDKQESSGVESSSLESTDLEQLDSGEAESLDSNVDVDAAAEEAETKTETEANTNEESDAELDADVEAGVEVEESTSGEDLAGEKVVEPLSGQKLKNILEAALMAVGKPMSMEQLMRLFEGDERPSANTVKSALAELQSDTEGRGIELKEVATGYRYQSRADYSEWLSRLWEEKAPKYSRAYLETLALIAYRQPVTRAEIEEVRGVGVSSSIVKTMLEREWIRVVGHRDVPGRPSLYATTKQFLDYFNMKSLDELPSLAEIRDLDDLNPELQLEEPGQLAEQEGESETGIDDEFSETESAQDESELADDELVDNSSEESHSEGESAELTDAELTDAELTGEELTDEALAEEPIEKSDIASEYIEASLTEIEPVNEAETQIDGSEASLTDNPNIENDSFESEPVSAEPESAEQDLPEVALEESEPESEPGSELESIEENIDHYLEDSSDETSESSIDDENHKSDYKD